MTLTVLDWHAKVYDYNADLKVPLSEGDRDNHNKEMMIAGEIEGSLTAYTYAEAASRAGGDRTDVAVLEVHRNEGAARRIFGDRLLGVEPAHALHVARHGSRTQGDGRDTLVVGYVD